MNQFWARAAKGALASAALALFTGSASAAGYDAVYAFGDSLSDNGNLFAATGHAAPQPGDYYQGRFSNGTVAVEYLAQGLGVPLFDFAYGGAQTNFLNGAMVAQGAPAALQNTGIQSQLGFYQASLAGGQADANALYFVWGGGNDFQFLGYTPAVASAAIQNLSSTILTLYGLGARSFLVPGLPDLGQTPIGLASGQSAQLQQLSYSFNEGLTNAANTGALDQLRALPGIQITYFDTLTTQHAAVANAASYGITDVTEGCFTGYVGVPGTQCSNPSAYLYWDQLHPSAVSHAILGAAMLAAVPEPGSMLLMAMGTMMLLGVVRRQRR